MSGVVSTRMLAVGVSTKMDERVRLSRGSVDWQTAHLQPIIGTPCDVPEPSTVTIILEAGDGIVMSMARRC